MSWRRGKLQHPLSLLPGSTWGTFFIQATTPEKRCFYTRHMLDSTDQGSRHELLTSLVYRISHFSIQATLSCFLRSPTLTILHANHASSTMYSTIKIIAGTSVMAPKESTVAAKPDNLKLTPETHDGRKIT